jgi:hypothetical protein
MNSRYEAGLVKLIQTEEQVTKMRTELENLRPQLAEK